MADRDGVVIETVTISAWRTFRHGETVGVQLALRRQDGSYARWRLDLGGLDDPIPTKDARRKIKHLCRAIRANAPRDAVEIERLFDSLVKSQRTARVYVDPKDGDVFWYAPNHRAAA